MAQRAPAAMMEAEEKIQEIARRIAAQFDPEKIILFGSYARGQAGPDSDADLLVVVRLRGSRRALTSSILRAVTGMGLPKDVVVVTPEEVERFRDVVGTVVYPALREGRILYERPA